MAPFKSSNYIAGLYRALILLGFFFIYVLGKGFLIAEDRIDSQTSIRPLKNTSLLPQTSSKKHKIKTRNLETLSSNKQTFQPKAHTTIWPNFCVEHICDALGCSSYIFKEGRPRYFVLEQDLKGYADCYIEPKLLAEFTPYLDLFPVIPAGSIKGLSRCYYGWCDVCNETLKLCVAYFKTNEHNKLTGEPLFEYFIEHKCSCFIHRPYVDQYTLEDDHYYCEKSVIPHTYFDRTIGADASNISRHLKYLQQNSSCKCYWPHASKQACEISDIVYDDLLRLLSKTPLYHLLKKSDQHWAPYLSYCSRTGQAQALTQPLFFYSDYLNTLDRLSVLSFSQVSNNEYEQIFSDLQKLKEILQEHFSKIYEECIAKHPHPKPYFERAILQFHRGNWSESLSDISKFIEMAEKLNLHELLTSDLYLCQGMGYIEANNFQNAFESLTRAIEKDPKNKQAYFERALVQFELGYYEMALADYLESNFEPTERRRLDINQAFLDAFCIGTYEGFEKSITELVPNLLSGIRGIGEGLWAFAIDPIETENRFYQEVAQTAYDLARFFKDNVTYENINQITYKLRDLYDNWDNLDHENLGLKIGHALGNYGTDILLVSTSSKGVELWRAYKRSSEAYTLCLLAIDEAKAARILAAAEERYLAREQLLKSYKQGLKIEYDKQGKHIVGHRNYREGKSIFTHSDPDRLLRENAGTGLKVNSEVIGQPGYREKVNFGEKIGYYVNSDKNLQVETTWGTIHYSKEGAHIVPAIPE